ncbi:HPP family protein [Halovenus sp. WSH3]|uniref:HPP family protein n=1 Tax=Halovenus carboxidivorans TaxID=2692199 RepID=A0A6B0T4W0_9EURY|nr:HPP family protein [Halovenus carboxidivorans]MXR51997.1 HPP family protein [Halovenus carboxidivorans]
MNGPRDSVQSVAVRIRRTVRYRWRDLRRWVESTQNFVHLSILLLVPLLIGFVTALSNTVPGLSFLLYPPLAAGAFTLFADPEGRYASISRFVGGLTLGAVCGWVAVVAASTLIYQPAANSVNPVAASLAVFLTGITTWLLDTEEPAAFSTALLTLFVQAQVERPEIYVLSVAASSAIVAGGFAVWREVVYERRDQFLYEASRGDDHILVPMRGPHAECTAMLAARLAAAHRAGKVVLLDLVAEEWIAEAERDLLEQRDGTHRPEATDSPDVLDEPPDNEAVANSVDRLERQAHEIETATGVPCEVVVATGGPESGQTALRAARRVNCDLIATPYEVEDERLSPFVRTLFRGDTDVLTHRTDGDLTEWNRILVPVRGTSDVAHGMVEFATRLAGTTGFVSVATCLGSCSEREHRQAESMLADLVEPFSAPIETRVVEMEVDTFLERNAPEYDLVIMGASRDRSLASRLLTPPTFQRVDELDVDVAIVDRN